MSVSLWGVMARGQRHSDEMRAAVVADLLSGCATGEVAARHGVAASTVRAMRRELPEQVEAMSSPARASLDALVLACVAANLAALRRMSEVAGDPTYFSAQPADKAAVLYGVIADKAIRILEAAQLGDDAA